MVNLNESAFTHDPFVTDTMVVMRVLRWRRGVAVVSVVSGLVLLLGACGNTEAGAKRSAAAPRTGPLVKASWSAPTVLSDPASFAHDPLVSVTASGSAAAATWILGKDAAPNPELVQSRFASIADNKTTWGNSTNVFNRPSGVGDLRMAVSADGTKATVAWLRAKRQGRTEVYVVFSASGVINGTTVVWGKATKVAVTGETDTSDTGPGLDLAMSADGTRATAIWNFIENDERTIQAASSVIKGDTATWGEATSIGTGVVWGSATHVTLSADGTTAVAVWQHDTKRGKWVIQTASASIAGTAATWGKATQLSPGGAWAPQVALSADGSRATATWVSAENLNIASASAIVAGASTTWGQISQLTSKDRGSWTPKLAMSADGTRATVLNGAQSVSATIVGTTPSWGPVTEVAVLDERDGGDFQIALSADGSRATAVWTVSNYAVQVVQTASASINGNTSTWSAPSTLSKSNGASLNPAVATSSDGKQAVVVWQRQAGGSTEGSLTTSVIETASGSITVTP